MAAMYTKYIMRSSVTQEMMASFEILPHDYSEQIYMPFSLPSQRSAQLELILWPRWSQPDYIGAYLHLATDPEESDILWIWASMKLSVDGRSGWTRSLPAFQFVPGDERAAYGTSKWLLRNDRPLFMAADGRLHVMAEITVYAIKKKPTAMDMVERELRHFRGQVVHRRFINHDGCDFAIMRPGYAWSIGVQQEPLMEAWPWFRNAIQSGMADSVNNVLEMDFEQRDVMHLVSFAYAVHRYGPGAYSLDDHINPDNVDLVLRLFHAAHACKLYELAKQCLKFAMTNISRRSLVITLLFALNARKRAMPRAYKLHELIATCKRFADEWEYLIKHKKSNCDQVADLDVFARQASDIQRAFIDVLRVQYSDASKFITIPALLGKFVQCSYNPNMLYA